MKRYLAVFERTNIGYSAYVPDLPGGVVTGKNRAETEQLIAEATPFHLDGLCEDGFDIPVPSSEAEVMVFA